MWHVFRRFRSRVCFVDTHDVFRGSKPSRVGKGGNVVEGGLVLD